MVLKTVMRSNDNALCLFRLTWDKGTVGDGKGYSVKLSLGLRPKWFEYITEYNGWIVTVLGVRIHRAVSFGGRFV